jgi:hypothetical protein
MTGLGLCPSNSVRSLRHTKVGRLCYGHEVLHLARDGARLHFRTHTSEYVSIRRRRTTQNALAPAENDLDPLVSNLARLGVGLWERGAGNERGGNTSRFQPVLDRREARLGQF